MKMNENEAGLCLPFPPQAGRKANGGKGERFGLWSEVFMRRKHLK